MRVAASRESPEKATVTREREKDKREGERLRKKWSVSDSNAISLSHGNLITMTNTSSGTQDDDEEEEEADDPKKYRNGNDPITNDPKRIRSNRSRGIRALMGITPRVILVRIGSVGAAAGSNSSARNFSPL